MSFYAYLRAGDARYQERFGLDFEEFKPGQRFRHRPGVTLSQQDNADEALDTLNGAMLHFDAHYAAATAWQRPLMVSTLSMSTTVDSCISLRQRAEYSVGLEANSRKRPQLIIGAATMVVQHVLSVHQVELQLAATVVG